MVVVGNSGRPNRFLLDFMTNWVWNLRGEASLN